MPAIGASERVAITLSLAAGATDAFAFLALGGIFTANMTGNLVLVALYQRPEYGATLAGALVAIGVFAVVLAAGFRLSRQRGYVPLLAAATALQLVVLAGGVERGDARLALIASSAGAMALQTVVARRSSLANVTTTYVTGTLTSLVQDLVDRKAGDRRLRLAAVLALPAGALVGAGAYALDARLGALPAFAASALALVLAARDLRLARPGCRAASPIHGPVAGAESQT